MLVSDENAEKAINYLAETDEQFARLKYQMEAYASKKDITEKTVFLHEDGNVEERKSKSRTHENTKQAQREYLDYMRQFEEMKNKRDTAHVTIWIWKAAKASERATV